jgi:ferric-dicitrate binding protein FerR (iron transport regulator)
MGSVNPDDDYLWKGEGEPDPDVQRLERTLGVLKYAPKTFEAPAEKVQNASVRPMPSKWRARAPVVVGVLLLAAAVLFVIRKKPWDGADPNAPAFAVRRVEGAPKVGAKALAESGKLPVGAWLETDQASAAKIAVADIGEVDVERGSRVRIVATAPNEHRLELVRGSIAAKVNAPPRLFVVDTPSASAVDLGCAYRLEVTPDGATTHLSVTAGQVSLEGKGRSAWVPAGAACDTRKDAGPGTPYAEDAAPKMIAALRRFDFENGGSPAAREALESARPRDVLSVWHVFRRANTDADVRREAREKMVAWRVVSRRARDEDIDRMPPEKVIWPDPISDW